MPQAPRPLTPEDWRILRILSLYRLLLVLLLLGLYELGYAPQFFSGVKPQWFQWTCNSYAAAAFLLASLVQRRRPRLGMQAHLHFLVDLAATTSLVYACGGVPSGLGALMITPAVGCAMVTAPRLAILQASMATLAMLGEESFRQIDQRWDTGDFTATGLLGLMFFGTSLAATAIAQRARQSEALAQRVGSEFQSLSMLNQSIIENMATGVLVVDPRGFIRAMNAAAQRLLGTGVPLLGRKLDEALPALAARLDLWWVAGLPDGAPLIPVPGGDEVVPAFARLSEGPGAPTMVTLEDSARLHEQAQQIKLAALGRLSASIAHEIRNPLSAIVHAGQLLAESESMGGDGDPENRRLLAMIQRHSERIDKIVRDVLALSRREPANPSVLPLHNWLVRTAGLYQEGFPDARRPIELADVPGDLFVRFDANHLQQILFNLWNNAFEHSRRAGHEVIVLLSAGRDINGRPWLDVADDGPGIPTELRDRMFEPFFTTSHGGTGLGLYLARELCEYNHARINFQQPARGACFRLLFAAESS